MDPFARLRSVGDRVAPPAEALAQHVAERVADLVIPVLDVNALLDRIDVDALLDRIDVDALLARVDMDSLLAQTDLGAVIARSSGGVAGNVLDVVRSEAVGLDEFTARCVGRLRHRPYTGPERAEGRNEVTTARAGDPTVASAPAAARASLQGDYAGFVSRFTAYIVDVGASTGVFLLALAALSFAVSVVTGKSVEWTRNDIWVGLAYLAWLFIYFAYSWAASGKTFGMAVLGVRVVRPDGADAGGRRAAVRTLALPLSFLLFGLGFLGILLGRERRALHDVIAGTVVIYSWDARAARLRFLSRASSAPEGGTPAGVATAMTSPGQPRAEPRTP
jgi:uncharacterized RDD family membrane protein YckC